MEIQYTAIAYCPGTGLALRADKDAFYMDPQGNIKKMFPLFPESAMLKHHYLSLTKPIHGDANDMFRLYVGLEQKFGNLS